MSQSNPRVVILGTGFGGLETTKTLRRAPVEIILIEPAKLSLFPAATLPGRDAALSPADIAWPIRHILRRQENAIAITWLWSYVTTVSAAVFPPRFILEINTRKPLPCVIAHDKQASNSSTDHGSGKPNSVEN